jgi:hypothetical protein
VEASVRFYNHLSDRSVNMRLLGSGCSGPH